MFDTILGLPVHVLIIHAVVIIGPLTALLAIAYAVRPAARAALRWPLTLGALTTGVAGFIAGESGEARERRVQAADAGDATALNLVHEHAEAGDLAKILCLVLMVLVLGAVFALLPPGRQPLGGNGLGLAVALVLIAASLATMTSVVITGHKGAKAAWADQVAGTSSSAPAPASGGGD